MWGTSLVWSLELAWSEDSYQELSSDSPGVNKPACQTPLIHTPSASIVLFASIEPSATGRLSTVPHVLAMRLQAPNRRLPSLLALVGWGHFSISLTGIQASYLPSGVGSGGA